MKRNKEIFPDWFAKGLYTAITIGGLILFTWGYVRWLEHSDTFTVNRIEVDGNEMLSSDELAEEGGVTPDMNIWTVDLAGVTRQLKEHVFVSEVYIQREFPNRIKVSVEEKKPVALLNYQSKLYCLDPEGLVLPSVPNKAYDLPVISGAFQGTLSLGQYVSGSTIGKGLQFVNTVLSDRPELYKILSEINIYRKGLKVYLSQSGIPVTIGDEYYQMKIRSLDAVLRDLVSNNSLKQVKYINLQYRGQVVVGMRT